MKPGLIFRSIFEFTASEAGGVAVLLPILLLVTFSGRIYNNYFRSDPLIVTDAGADSLLFWILLDNTHGLQYPQFFQQLSRHMWDMPENHDTVVALVGKTVDSYVQTGTFSDGQGAD